MAAAAVSVKSGGGGGGGDSKSSDALSLNSIALPSRPLRVLFMHGLESSPFGTKYQMLCDAGFDVLCPDMMGVLSRLRRPKTRAQWRFVATVLLGVCGVLALVAYAVARAQYVAALFVAVLSGVCGVALFRSMMASIVAACLALQAKAIRDFQPDVLLGLSWGGGMATFSMLNGTWRGGPVLLLCPGGSRIQRLAALQEFPQPININALFNADPTAPDLPLFSPTIHVVHSKYDTTIPYADTVSVFGGDSLAARSGHVTIEPITSDRTHALRAWCSAEAFKVRIVNVWKAHQLRIRTAAAAASATAAVGGAGSASTATN